MAQVCYQMFQVYEQSRVGRSGVGGRGSGVGVEVGIGVGVGRGGVGVEVGVGGGWGGWGWSWGRVWGGVGKQESTLIITPQTRNTQQNMEHRNASPSHLVVS